jgi:RNA polymerase sigma-70 factor, ECF subfamily
LWKEPPTRVFSVLPKDAVAMAIEQTPAYDRSTEFVRLLTQHDRGIMLFILSLVPNWTDAEEIQQETNVKLWLEFGKFRAGSDFGAWARTVAWYEVLTFRERNRRQWLLTSTEFLESVAADAAATTDSAGPRQEALAECVEQLGAFGRELLRLHYTMGLKVKVIAEKLRSTSDAVYKALQRVRVELRQCIDHRLNDEEGP